MATPRGTERDRPYAIAYDPVRNYLWAANHSAGTVSVRDMTSGRLIRTLRTGPNPTSIVLDTKRRMAYVVNSGNGRLSCIRMDSETVSESIEVGQQPQMAALNPHNGDVWVTNCRSNNLSVVTPATGEVLFLETCPNPVGIAIDTSARLAYVASSTAREVAVVDLNTGDGGDRIRTPQVPLNLTVDPVKGTLYVLHPEANCMTIWQRGERTRFRQIALGDYPANAVVDEARETLTVANYGNRSVMLLDAVDGKVLETQKTAQWPLGLALNSKTGAIMVAGVWENSLEVIQPNYREYRQPVPHHETEPEVIEISEEGGPAIGPGPGGVSPAAPVGVMGNAGRPGQGSATVPPQPQPRPQPQPVPVGALTNTPVAAPPRRAAVPGTGNIRKDTVAAAAAVAGGFVPDLGELSLPLAPSVPGTGGANLAQVANPWASPAFAVAGAAGSPMGTGNTVGASGPGNTTFLPSVTGAPATAGGAATAESGGRRPVAPGTSFLEAQLPDASFAGAQDSEDDDFLPSGPGGIRAVQPGGFETFQFDVAPANQQNTAPLSWQAPDVPALGVAPPVVEGSRRTMRRLEIIPPGALGQRIAQEAYRMYTTGASRRYHRRCDRLADTTVRAVTDAFDHVMGPRKDDTAAKTMKRFQDNKIGFPFTANTRLAPGDILYAGARVGDGCGHVMIVGPSGEILDQYGARVTPLVQPEWVVRPDQGRARGLFSDTLRPLEVPPGDVLQTDIPRGN